MKRLASVLIVSAAQLGCHPPAARPPNPTGGSSATCTGGFEAVESESQCIADASCYELAAGGWCTGVCPGGTELDLDGEPTCVPATAVCLEPFTLVDTESECIADATCYPSGGKFCTGTCPAGTVFTSAETGPGCIPQ